MKYLISTVAFIMVSISLVELVTITGFGLSMAAGGGWSGKFILTDE